MPYVNHYKYCDKHLPAFFKAAGIDFEKGYAGVVAAHGDKCYQYKDEWEENGIPFPHGVAIYLIGSTHKFGKELRQTDNGWIAPDDWVIANYESGHKFKNILPAIDENDEDVLSKF